MIGGFRGLLKRLLCRAPRPAIPTRLASADAVALAKQAASDHWLRDSLNVATATRREDGTVVWTVETGGVGSFLRITIDDATGAVLDRKAHSGR